MPVIAPPRNATASAAGMPLRAASAVRTFARTEMFMPMNPVRPDRIAPIAKPIAVDQPRPGTNPITRNRTAPTIAIVRYWRLRYARAPSWIAAAISCMRGLPAGLDRIQRIDQMP